MNGNEIRILLFIIAEIIVTEALISFFSELSRKDAKDVRAH